MQTHCHAAGRKAIGLIICISASLWGHQISQSGSWWRRALQSQRPWQCGKMSQQKPPEVQDRQMLSPVSWLMNSMQWDMAWFSREQLCTECPSGYTGHEPVAHPCSEEGGCCQWQLLLPWEKTTQPKRIAQWKMITLIGDTHHKDTPRQKANHGVRYTTSMSREALVKILLYYTLIWKTEFSSPNAKETLTNWRI